MNFWTWLFVVNLLPLAAVGLFASGRGRHAAPWLALATVVVGTVPAFTVSVTLATYGSIGGMFGVLIPMLYCMVTPVYGLTGLGILALSVRLQPVAFVPLGIVLAGLVYVASFYAYLPPHSFSPAGMLVFAVPGLALVIYGAELWRRNGLSGGLGTLNPALRLVMALGIAAAFGVAGFLASQTEPDRPNWTARPIDLPTLAASAVLVVEGEVVHKEPWSRESRLPSSRTHTLRYTRYRVEVSERWRGEVTGTVSIAVADWSPVDLAQSQPYLLFFSGMADQEDFPGHWRLSDPHQVWTVESSSFHPHFGLSPSALLSRHEVGELLVKHPLNTPTPQSG